MDCCRSQYVHPDFHETVNNARGFQKFVSLYRLLLSVGAADFAVADIQLITSLSADTNNTKLPTDIGSTLLYDRVISFMLIDGPKFLL